MNEHQKDFLRKLITTPSPSGFEERASEVWRAEASTFADSVEWDVLGNSYARLANESGPKVVIEGHIDEIGFIVTYIDDEGFIWFDKIGGWDDQVIVGQRITIAGPGGDVKGVIGKKASHLLTPADREKVTKSSDLWIDIGAATRAEAETRVSVGDAAVVDVLPIELTDDLWASRSMDNRVGAFVALEALRLLADERPIADVYAVSGTQEEIGLVGATHLSFRLSPAVGIAIDVTHSTDYPGASPKADNKVRLGGGPVLTRGAVINPKVYEGLREAAKRLDIPYAVQAAARVSATDADAFTRSGAGVAAGLVSIPNRYMHSPNEVISLSDLESASRVIAEFVRTITPESDFRR
ncbi:MAG TPA: M42 family metallopeptidase [Thermomicrobiales bacterium]|nr:M42 family metallopeptidase [Thermomicrobiales bacterium]